MAPALTADSFRDSLVETKQEHLLAFWDEISSDAALRDQLVAQLSVLDPARCNRIFHKAVSTPPSAAQGLLEPLPSTVHSSVKPFDQPDADREAWRKLGNAALARGEVAVLLLAGGQGTRLGSSLPKGCYDVGLPSHKSLFQVQAERIAKAAVLANKEAGLPGSARIPWYVMTSGPTRAETEKFFKASNYWGLSPEDVIFFEQGTLPAFSTDGKILLDTKSSLSMSPDGNGGVYSALEREGVLASMRQRGIKAVHAYCVDNILVRVPDPIFIGYCLAKGSDCGIKVVPKAYPTESVGLICLRDKVVSAVEYSEISKADAEKTDPTSGALLLRAANIANHFFTVDFLERAAHEIEPNLEYHIARKKVKFVDPATGKTIVPESTNAIKLELFIFDVIPFAVKPVVLEVPRNEEFSPLKNAPGAGKDCPETCHDDYIALSTAYLKNAGAVVPEGAKIELSPLITFAGEGLESVKGRAFAADAGYLASL